MIGQLTASSEHINQLPSLDAEYRFGHPKTYLAPHELARLTILRSKLGDTRSERAAERIARHRRGRKVVALAASSVSLPKEGLSDHRA